MGDGQCELTGDGAKMVQLWTRAVLGACIFLEVVNCGTDSDVVVKSRCNFKKSEPKISA